MDCPGVIPAAVRLISRGRCLGLALVPELSQTVELSGRKFMWVVLSGIPASQRLPEAGGSICVVVTTTRATAVAETVVWLPGARTEIKSGAPPGRVRVWRTVTETASPLGLGVKFFEEAFQFPCTTSLGSTVGAAPSTVDSAATAATWARAVVSGVALVCMPRAA